MYLMARPTIEDVRHRLTDLSRLDCPLTSNKGLPGLLLEHCVGVPQSSAHLDCSDGEIKLFPLKRLKDGALVPKETIAVTMLNKALLSVESEFASSRCGTKLARVLYVPYLREGDSVRLFAPSDVVMTPEMCADLTADYDAIRTQFLADGTLESKTGALLQTRTKGAGGEAPKTRAFYLRTQFIHRYITKTW